MNKTEILDFAGKWLGLFPWWALPLIAWQFLFGLVIWDWSKEPNKSIDWNDILESFLIWLVVSLILLWTHYA